MKQLVKVEWVDISLGAEWADLEDITEWAKEKWKEGIVTIGYLVLERKQYIVVAASYDITLDTYHDYSIIPKGAIKRVKRVERQIND